MRKAVSIICLLALLALPAGDLAAGLDEGTEAFERGDYRTALHAWEPLAEAGDPAAQYNIAILFEYGLGVFKDIDQAVQWYVKSAEQGFPDAQVTVGDLYLDGYWGRPDEKEAADWYRFAAEQGHQEAIDRLAGLGVEQEAALPRLDPPPVEILTGAPCDAVPDREFKVKVEMHFPDPPINHSLSIDQLSQKTFHGRETQVLGLMQPDLNISTQNKYGTLKVGKTLCFWVERVQVRMIYRAIEVYVARDYKRGSCEYRAVLAHEKAHVKVARENLNRYAPEVRRALTSLIIPTPSRPVEIDRPQAADEALKRLYNKILDPVYKRMLSELQAKQAALDTPQSYAKVRRRCRSW